MNWGLQIRQIWIQLITDVGNICEKVFKVLVTDLDELKQQPRMELPKLDHAVIAVAIGQWRCR